MSHCVIRFDNNPQGVYYGGQLLAGSCVLTTTKQKTIRAIHIQINGYAKVRWTERKSRTRDGKTEYYTETYTGHEQYLSSRTYVSGRDSGDSFELPAGIYTYNFQVQLPQQIPSSFAGVHGHIRYEVVLTVDRPWRFDNEFIQPFTVIGTLNLNMDSRYKIPIQREEVKEFWCGCCNVGPLKVRCTIPFSGYAPGQKIPFTILIQNESGIDCYGSKIKLDKTVRFTSTSPYSKSRYHEDKITEKQLGEALKLTNKEYKDFLQLPAIPPSSLQTCRIIEVSYMITVVAYTSGCHRNAELNIPITIGTVPLYESATNPANVISVQPTAPSAPTKIGDSPPPYIPNAPPTYEDAMAGGGDAFVDDDENKHTKTGPFIPKYPVYYNFATPSAPANAEVSTAPVPNASTSSAPPYPPPNAGEMIQPANNDQVPEGKVGVTYGWNA